MGRPGLEPGTNRLKAEYSTIELATRKYLFSTHLLTLARLYFFCNPFEKIFFSKFLEKGGNESNQHQTTGPWF